MLPYQIKSDRSRYHNRRFASLTEARAVASRLQRRTPTAIAVVHVLMPTSLGPIYMPVDFVNRRPDQISLFDLLNVVEGIPTI